MDGFKRTRQARELATATAVTLALSATVLVEARTDAVAAESAKSIYLLGSNAGLAGFVPPPGMYFSDINSYYSASASGAAADSILLEDVGSITREARLSVDSTFS